MVFENVLLNIRDVCDPLWQMSRLSKNPNVLRPFGALSSDDHGNENVISKYNFSFL